MAYLPNEGVTLPQPGTPVAPAAQPPPILSNSAYPAAAAAAAAPATAPPVFSTPQFQQPSNYNLTAPPPNFNYTPVTPPAPMDFSSILSLYGQMPNNQIAAPQLPEFNVPKPQYLAPPTSQSYMNLLQQYGIVPAPGSQQANQMLTPVQAPSVGVSIPSFSPPTYQNSQTIMERVNNMLNLQYSGQEDKLNWAMDELLRDLNMNVNAQTEYGTLGDQKLQGIYGDLEGRLNAATGRISDLYNAGEQKVAGYYDQSQQGINDKSAEVQALIASLGDQLGIGAGIPDATKWLTSSIADAQANNLMDRSNSLGNLATLGTNMGAASIQDTSNAMTLGANKRADLQNLVQGNIGAMRMQYGKEKSGLMQDMLSLTKEKGYAAKDFFSELEDEDYERNYRQSVDAQNFGLQGAQIGLQAAGINANMQMAAAELTFKKQQAFIDTLKDTYQFAEQNKWMEYGAQKDYNQEVQNWFKDRYAANMEQSLVGLDVSKFNASMGQQNFQNALASAGFMGDQNQNMFNNQMANNQFGLEANNSQWNNWGTQNQIGMANSQNQWSNFGLLNNIAQGNQANAISNYATLTNAQQNQQSNAFDQWFKTQGLNLDWTQFNASQDPNSFQNQLATYKARNDVQQAANALQLQGQSQAASNLLGILNASTNLADLQAKLATQPLEIQQMLATLAKTKADTAYTEAATNGTIPGSGSTTTNPLMPKTPQQQLNELFSSNGISSQSNPKFLDMFNKISQDIIGGLNPVIPLGGTSNTNAIVYKYWNDNKGNMTAQGLNPNLMLQALQTMFGQG